MHARLTESFLCIKLMRKNCTWKCTAPDHMKAERNVLVTSMLGRNQSVCSVAIYFIHAKNSCASCLSTPDLTIPLKRTISP